MTGTEGGVMTELHWFRCTNPQEMLHKPGWLRATRREVPNYETCHPRVSSERKFRLYACACLRLAFPQLLFAADRAALDLSERYADGESVEVELESVAKRCGAMVYGVTERPAVKAARAAFGGEKARSDHPAGRHVPLTNAMKCQLLRDIFGNPFRPVAINPSWLTSTAVAIAQGIYDDKAFDRLPILADALQDAGCENADILSHLRSDGPHVRGCWALDLVLGKE